MQRTLWYLSLFGHLNHWRDPEIQLLHCGIPLGTSLSWLNLSASLVACPVMQFLGCTRIPTQIHHASSFLFVEWPWFEAQDHLCCIFYFPKCYAVPSWFDRKSDILMSNTNSLFLSPPLLLRSLYFSRPLQNKSTFSATSTLLWIQFTKRV